jgi:hypothetical protein
MTWLATGALAATLCAQTAAKKPVIQGDLIDDSTPPAATNAPAPASAVTAKAVPLAKPAAAAPTAVSNKKDDVQEVEFSKLAGYEYVVPDFPATNQVPGADVADKQIPSDVKALNRKKVTITGYLMPLKEVEGKSTEFLIMRTQSSCCFGIAPSITELITVKAAGDGVPPIMDDLVEIQGTLKVGTVREDGYIVGVYQMDEGKFIGRASR